MFALPGSPDFGTMDGWTGWKTGQGREPGEVGSLFGRAETRVNCKTVSSLSWAIKARLDSGSSRHLQSHIRNERCVTYMRGVGAFSSFCFFFFFSCTHILLSSSAMCKKQVGRLIFGKKKKDVYRGDSVANLIEQWVGNELFLFRWKTHSGYGMHARIPRN